MRAWLLRAVVLGGDGLGWLATRRGTLVWLLALGAVSHTTASVAPPCAAHYRLHDRVSAIVRACNARDTAPGDSPELRDGLMAAVRELGLENAISDGDFVIESTSVHVRVSCRYAVPVRVLPGLVRRLRFRLVVDEPVLPRPDPRFL